MVNQLISKFYNYQVSGKLSSEHYFKASLGKGGSRSELLMDTSHLCIVNDIHYHFERRAKMEKEKKKEKKKINECTHMYSDTYIYMYASMHT